MDKEERKAREFLYAWVKWVESGADDHPHFRRMNGLCESYQRMYKCYGSRALSIFFRQEGLSTVFPFGVDEWYRDQEGSSMHMCPKRIAFARKYAISPSHLSVRQAIGMAVAMGACIFILCAPMFTTLASIYFFYLFVGLLVFFLGLAVFET